MDQFVEILLTKVVPMVVEVATVLGVFISLRNNMKSLREDVNIQEVKQQTKAVLQENRELKKQLKELLTKIDKVQR